MSAETAWGIARVLLVALLLVILLIRVFEDRMVFFPEPARSSDQTPAQAGVKVEDVFLTTSDGVKIHTWWAETPGAQRTVLYFHGNAGNLSLRLPTIGWLQQLPANVLAVDYRGYGKSEGKPTEEGVYRDGEAAYDYLVREHKIPAEQIVVLGQSLGTTVAVDVASKKPVGAVILEAGFPSAKRVAQVAMRLPGVWLVGTALFFYGLANGVISPMQKSLLTQNAPTELRGGIVSFDRLIQQVSKTVATSVVGLLLVTTELSTIFWLLGILSFISVALMALLLPNGKQ